MRNPSVCDRRPKNSVALDFSWPLHVSRGEYAREDGAVLGEDR